MPVTTHSIENERIYLVPEATLFTAVPPANSNACRLTRGSFTPQFPTMIRRDKTGSFSIYGEQLGRIGGTWSLEMDVAGNGSAGTAPDCGPLLNAAFGALPTIVTSTSVTYNNSDASYMIDIWDFSPSGYAQFAALGCVVSDLELSWGDNFATLRASGDCVIIMDNTYFTSVPVAAWKLGLTSYPTEPTTPVTNGNAVVGFDGIATLDGNVISEITTGSFRYTTGRRMIRDTFGSYIATGIEQAKRNVTMQFMMNDAIDANLIDLITKSKLKTAVTLAMQMGTTAGNIWSPTLNNVMLNPPTRQDGQLRFMWSFPQSMGQETSLTSKDECVLALT